MEALGVVVIVVDVGAATSKGAVAMVEEADECCCCCCGSDDDDDDCMRVAKRQILYTKKKTNCVRYCDKRAMLSSLLSSSLLS